MFSLIGLIFACIGFMAVFFFIMVFFGFQSETLFSKQYKFLKYQITVNSTKGKDLTIEIKKF